MFGGENTRASSLWLEACRRRNLQKMAIDNHVRSCDGTLDKAVRNALRKDA